MKRIRLCLAGVIVFLVCLVTYAGVREKTFHIVLTETGTGTFTMSTLESDSYIASIRFQHDIALVFTGTVKTVTAIRTNGVAVNTVTNIVFQEVSLVTDDSMTFLPDNMLFIEAGDLIICESSSTNSGSVIGQLARD